MSTPSLLNIPYRLKAGTLYSQIPETGLGDFVVTRSASNVATRVNSFGFIETVADNVPRLDYPVGGVANGCPSLLIEASSTNLVLHSRDLTNVAWVSTNVTPVKNAVGADNVASGATTLTATAANATILQSLTHTSQSRIFSAYVRRVTGTGTIEMTTDGGTNWTAVTITSSYTRVACAPQTVTNGSVGFRIVTSGDAIVVDFCQSESGTIATSAIPTTTVAITRGADVIRKTGITSILGQSEGTVYFEVEVTDEARNKWFCTLDSSATSFIQMWVNPSRQISAQINNSGTIVVSVLTSSVLTLGYHKVAFAYNTATNGCIMYVDGVQNPATTRTVGSPGLPAFNDMRFGGYIAGITESIKGHIRAGAVYPNRLSNTELAALTQP